MLYRDSPTAQVSVRVRATAAEVWAQVSDITLSARHSPELQEVAWLDGATAATVGARFRGRNRNEHLGEWTTTSVVVELEEGRRLVWQVLGDEGPMATWGFEVDPGRDAVTVRHWARMGPAPSGLSRAIRAMPEKEARIVEHRLEEWRAGMSATLEGLRTCLEGPGDHATR